MSEGDNAVPAPREPPPPQPVFKEPRPVNPNSLPFFSRIVEDIIVNIFGRLEEDPRDLARLACVCRRFHNVVKSSCYKRQCLRVVPTIVSELMQSSTRQDVLGEPPGGWAALQKLLVCCPGLRPAGVLLNCWDFGLERDIGRSDDFELVHRQIMPNSGQDAEDDSSQGAGKNPVVSLKVFEGNNEEKIVGAHGNQSCCRKGTGQESALMAETMAKLESAILQTSETSGCSSSVETSSRNDDPTGIDDADSDAGKGMFGKRKNWAMMGGDGPIKQMKKGGIHYHNKVMNNSRFNGVYKQSDRDDEHGGIRSPRYRERRRSRQRSGDINLGRRITETEEAQVNHEEEPHLAKGAWILTREQGNKLLASRFRSDSLYICDWPGCAHQGQKRVYNLFRGIFKNFQHSHVFRNLKDLKAKRTEIRCAFCSEGTYDMVTSFCLRRSFEYHEDGEPVIRAYVCESGHVVGAWTDRPLYNM